MSSSSPSTSSGGGDTGSKGMEVYFHLPAFSKVILHVTKYPQHPVNGVLLRKRSKDEDNSLNKINVHDSIPLIHMCKYVTPMMELALAQIEQYCKGSKYEIVGYYQANQSLNDNNPDFVAQRIAEKLTEVNPNLIVAIVNNSQLNSNLECAPFNLYQLMDGKLKRKESKMTLLPDEDGALSTVSALIQAKAYRNLIDFDNHLDDITLNYWVNPEVNEQIKQLSS